MVRSTLFTLASFLPPLLLTLAFSLSVVTTFSERWVTRRDYSVNSNHEQNLKGLLHRSPFVRCLILPEVPGDIDAEPTYLPAECVRSIRPGGTCYSSGGDTPLLCSAITLTCQLLISGCVLLGLACILSIALFTFDLLAPSASATQQPYRPSRLRHHRRGHDAASSSSVSFRPRAIFNSSTPILLLIFFSVTGTICIALAHFLGAWALLSQQLPNALFAAPGSPDFLGAWYADRGLTYVGVAWVLAGSGALFMGFM